MEDTRYTDTDNWQGDHPILTASAFEYPPSYTQAIHETIRQDSDPGRYTPELRKTPMYLRGIRNAALAPHFALHEFLQSKAAERENISVKCPPRTVHDNLRVLAEEALEPIRQLIGAPVHILSGYRTPELQQHLSGKRGGIHTEGRAALIWVSGLTGYRLYALVRQAQDEGARVDNVSQSSGAVHVSTK